MRKWLSVINRVFWRIADRAHTIVWLAELLGFRSIAVALLTAIAFAVWSYISKLPAPVIALIGLGAFAATLIAARLGVSLYRMSTSRHRDDATSTAARSGAADIFLLAPKRKYALLWDPDRNLQMITTPCDAPFLAPQTSTRLPLFLIKNIGDAVAQNVTVKWTIDTSSLDDVVRRSAIFRDHILNFAGGMFGISSADGSRSWSCAYSSTGVTKLPFLAQSIDNTTFEELAIPFQVYASIEMFLAASMPTQLGTGVATTFQAHVEWSNSQQTVSRTFDIRATAYSMRPMGSGTVMIPDAESGKMRIPPRLMGEISFNVERRDDSK